ncbi:hypothetical protein JQ580_24020 [Bradyrhizobium japonicum]|uniref:hypothetical protein n=1 Tax=Bradyrhizobium japonicum TaxID=375 RepID=UPI001BADFAA8|nr:hypothetical protein [Bradyrhizobium japonicum]MBR0993796.1 hypothetical protein [Bradyrhizobium japonicum]
MTEKYVCEAALYASFKKTARWRDAVAQQFPSDPRNAAAAELLRQMGKETNLTDQQWRVIAPHFDRSERWSEALSATVRVVGIRPGYNDFPSFTSRLIEALVR